MTELNMRTKSLHIAVVFRIQVCLFMSYCDLVKSHVLICHFIRLHLVPLPPYLLTNGEIKRLWCFLFWWEIPLCVISCYDPSLTCSGDGANWRKIQRLKAAKHANTALKQSRCCRGLRGCCPPPLPQCYQMELR